MARTPVRAIRLFRRCAGLCPFHRTPVEVLGEGPFDALVEDDRRGHQDADRDRPHQPLTERKREHTRGELLLLTRGVSAALPGDDFAGADADQRGRGGSRDLGQRALGVGLGVAAEDYLQGQSGDQDVHRSVEEHP